MNEVAETKFQVASFVIHQQQRVSSISVRKTVLISIALLVFFLGTRKCVGRWWCIFSPLLQCARKRDLETDWQEICNHKTRYPEKKGKKREITSSELMPSPFFRTCPFLPLAKLPFCVSARRKTRKNHLRFSFAFWQANVRKQNEQILFLFFRKPFHPPWSVGTRRRGRRSQGRKRKKERKKRKISLVQNIYEKEGKKCPLGYR